MCALDRSRIEHPMAIQHSAQPDSSHILANAKGTRVLDALYSISHSHILSGTFREIDLLIIL